MAKPYPNACFSFTAWWFQHVVYIFCHWYFFHHKNCALQLSEQLDSVNKPVIFAAAPHLSHADVVLVPASIPARLLPVRWLADKKIFNGPLKSLWLKLWGAIPVERDQYGSFKHEDIRWITGFSKQGHSVGVFPECCLVGGRFGDPHRDLVSTALRNNIPVIPVCLAGTERAERLSYLTGSDNHAWISIGAPLSEPADLLDGLTPDLTQGNQRPGYR